jgi:hypothetical protein
MMVGVPSAVPSTAASSSSNRKNGIDVVLGAQWGDEGKGKLVDLLSQVSTKIENELKQKVILTSCTLSGV